MEFESKAIRLKNGEFIGMGAVELTSIPDISLLKTGQDDDAVYRSVQQSVGGLLSELYQFCRQDARPDGAPCDLAAELLWTGVPVQNQPYEADVQLTYILRCIDKTEAGALSKIRSLLNTVCLTLDALRYEYRPVSPDRLASDAASARYESVLALCREERVDNLQNQYLPTCYSFDRFPAAAHNMAKLTGALIHAPGCSVSMQLIPVRYLPQEAEAIEQTTQMLSSLTRGVGGPGTEVALAEQQLSLYKYYAARKAGALFSFSALVIGGRAEARELASRVYGELNADPAAPLRMQFVPMQAAALRRADSFYAHPWIAQEALLQTGRPAGIPGSAYARLSSVITDEEAASLFMLPVGSPALSAGFTVNTAAMGGKAFSDNLINTGDLPFGRLRSSSRGDTIGLSLADLTRHTLIVGTPGSGKTTFSVGLLDRLWKQHHIPFLVIEPAKTEYRALISSIPELQIFTPGKSAVSPFVFNPFLPPKNVRLEAYKSVLKTAFAAAVSMASPLDKIFEESIHNCYADFGWLDSYTRDDGGAVFNIADFTRCFTETFDSIGYTGDAKNIGRAGTVRLNGLARLFDNYFSVPIEDLLQKPTVIELAAIENSDEKALLISLLLLSILSYVNANYLGDGKLKNVLLLEEAHVLLDADSAAAQGEANPSAVAQGLVKRMLAEIRSYGVGMVIADQSPRKVTADIVALTDIKLAFRLVEQSDKEIFAGSAGMADQQRDRLARLKPGEAFLFFHRLEEPEEIVTENYRLEHNIEITLSDESIARQSAYWSTRQAELRPYPECALTPYCRDCCDMQRRQIAREIARRVFLHRFSGRTVDRAALEQVFSHLTACVRAELPPNVTLTRPLLSCVKTHLLRRVKYASRIPRIDALIAKSLGKE